MSSKADQIRKRLKEMAGEFVETTLFAQVKSVNEAEQTCVLSDDDNQLDFYDVRLRPVIDGQTSITMIPKVGTWVLALRIEDSDDWLITAVGEIDKLLITCDNVVINGGSKGGLVNWIDAKAQHDLVKNFITALKAVVEGAPIPEPGSGSPSALQAALGSALSSIAVPNFENLVDNKVKH